jgi:hypothetical protein
MITIRNYDMQIVAILTLAEYLALSVDDVCRIIEGV